VVLGAPYTRTPGWGEIGSGFFLLAVVAFIFVMNTFVFVDTQAATFGSG
jgi:hypothetical protein